MYIYSPFLFPDVRYLGLFNILAHSSQGISNPVTSVLHIILGKFTDLEIFKISLTFYMHVPSRAHPYPYGSNFFQGGGGGKGAVASCLNIFLAWYFELPEKQIHY